MRFLSKLSVHISLNKVRGLVKSTSGGIFGVLLLKGRLIGKGLNLGNSQGLGGGIFAFLFLGMI